MYIHVHSCRVTFSSGSPLESGSPALQDVPATGDGVGVAGGRDGDKRSLGQSQPSSASSLNNNNNGRH